MRKFAQTRHDQDGRPSSSGRTGRELVEANRRMREFVALLGHELCSPLAAMRHALFVAQQQDDTTDRERSLGVMDRQLQFVVSLVSDLADVSCIELGKMRLHIRPLNLARALDDAAESVRGAIEQCGHRLEVSLPPDSASVDADPVRLKQLLTNLLNNAKKYTPAGGRIWLTAEVQECEVVFRVRDSGIGISPEWLPHVFDPFWQGAHSRSGIGIGLNLVRRLAELHGGSVSVSSDGLNRGSEFVVRLPAHAESWNNEPSDPHSTVSAARNALSAGSTS